VRRVLQKGRANYTKGTAAAKDNGREISRGRGGGRGWGGGGGVGGEKRVEVSCTAGIVGDENPLPFRGPPNVVPVRDLYKRPSGEKPQEKMAGKKLSVFWEYRELVCTNAGGGGVSAMQQPNSEQEKAPSMVELVRTGGVRRGVEGAREN